jgi:hypothetical protein
MNDSSQYLMIGGDGRQYGPVSATELRQWIQDGRAVANTQVQVAGSSSTWRSLSEFPEFGPLPLGAYAKPLGGQPPVAIRVFGILYIAFGGMGLLCSPMTLLGLAQMRTMFGNNPAALSFFAFSGVLSIAGAGVMLAAGIGLVRQREWARRLAVIYSWASIVLGLVSTVLTVMFLAGRAGSAPEMWGGLIGGVIGGLFGLAFNGVTIYFLTRPAVKEFLASRARATS